MSRRIAQPRIDGTPQQGEAPAAPPIYERLLRSSHIFASAVQDVLERELLQEATRLPVTVRQLHLLKLMTLDGQPQVGEAAAYLGVSPPAATRSIDKLARLGLVLRAPLAGDRRATVLSVSAKGRRLVERYELLKAERLAAAVARLRPREPEELVELLDRFAVALLLLAQGSDDTCMRCAAYLARGCSVSAVRGGCPHEKLLAARPAGSAGEAQA